MYCHLPLFVIYLNAPKYQKRLWIFDHFIYGFVWCKSQLLNKCYFIQIITNQTSATKSSSHLWLSLWKHQLKWRLQKHCHAMYLCIRKIADQLISMLYVNESVSIISTLLFTIYHSQNISKCPPTGKWWHLLCELALLETALISLSNCLQ